MLILSCLDDMPSPGSAVHLLWAQRALGCPSAVQLHGRVRGVRSGTARMSQMSLSSQRLLQTHNKHSICLI